MKRIINILISAAVLSVIGSCNESMLTELPVDFNDEIVLEFSSVATKAEDTSVESYLNHVDVMIFDYVNDAPGTLVHHERIDVRGAASSVLGAQRSSFTSGTSYYIQIVANSTAEASVFAGMSDYPALVNMMQQDTDVHITGEVNSSVAPDYFLMDGVAYSSDAEPSAPETVVLNNGVESDDTVLKVTLRRAAAKVVVNLTFEPDASSGLSDLKFNSDLIANALYQVRNLPIETFVLDNVPSVNTELKTTSYSNNSYFTYPAPVDGQTVTSSSVKITAYTYPHDWTGQSTITHEPSIIVNLPVKSDSEVIENNWYKIPMSADDKFDRNLYYEVNVTVKRLGASSVSTAETLEDINYNVKAWDNVNINVGDNARPDYLYVNIDNLTMSNIDTDEISVEFASSDVVSITYGEIWYTDKFGQRQTVSNANAGIVITPDPGLNGNIKVYSPLPDNNTVRNFSFTVRNGSLSHTITVVQYPLEYITNSLSWYSYRSDFLSNSGDPTGTATGKHYENRASYGRFSAYHTNGLSGYGGNSPYFRSKYVNDTYPTSHEYKGLSDVNTYTSSSTSDFNDPYNARMYHIRIMASSGSYVVGRPKITDGVTDPGEDNALLVSPSFMIASRLGTLTTSNIGVTPDLTGVPAEPDPEYYGAKWGWGWYWPEGSDQAGYNAAMEVYEAAYQQARNKAYIKLYAEHCKQYVEVYDPDNNPNTDNSIHYNDFRLPTKAELEIIYRFQGKEGDVNVAAIDYLLNAGAYFSASGPVTNPNSNMNGMSVRCIRDAY